jgi:exosortase A
MTVAYRSGSFARSGGFAPAWRRQGGWIAAAWAALAILFHADVRDLADIYWNSTTFGHCLFVLPVVGWLVWQRRAELALVAVAPWWPALAIVALGGAVWFAGEVAGVALARHLGLVAMMQGAAVTLLGVQATRALLFPIAYLIFLVPFGEFLEAPLQDVTVAILMPLLHLSGVHAVVDGVLITTSAGYFEVAEACSGAKFLIAMVAYGTLVANVCFVSWRRRAAFMGVALVVPVLANGLRAWGTIYAAERTSVEAATGFDHIVYGWVFFAFVMLMVLAIGWRWFDRDPDAPWFDPRRLAAPPRRTIDAPTATGAIVAVAVLWAGAAWAVDRREAELPATLDLPDVPGWTRIAGPARAPWTPHYPGADHFVLGRYADAGGGTVDLAIATYANQHEGKEMVGFGIGAIRENDRWIRVHDLPLLARGAAVRMTHAGPVERETVTWHRIGSIVTGDARAVKLETLRVKLTGGDVGGAAVLMSAERSEGRDSRATIERFLAAAGPVERIADTALGR